MKVSFVQEHSCKNVNSSEAIFIAAIYKGIQQISSEPQTVSKVFFRTTKTNLETSKLAAFKSFKNFAILISLKRTALLLKPPIKQVF